MSSRILNALICLFAMAFFGTLFVSGQSLTDKTRDIESVNVVHISNFLSIEPIGQTTNFQFPATHQFQYIVEEGTSHTIGSSSFGDNFDFTGFVPKNGSSSYGTLGVSHETSPGGVSMMDITLDNVTHRWEIENTQAVDFSGVHGTARNCSGTITPWNTFVTCEEAEYTVDGNGDGYNDVGWCIEIDPITRTIVDQTGGLNGPEKLWALGNFQHENMVVNPTNKRTAYTGRDHTTGYLLRFVADNAEDLSSGTLAALKMTSGANGVWIPLNNTTKAERNSTNAQAAAAGATVYNGIEDVEIGPDGLIYFAVKNESRVYRFRDDDVLNGTTVSQFETYVGGRNYNITHANGVTSTPWGGGNDNLAFDDLGNLWVNQDGGNNYIWMVEAGHTQAAPKVKIFGTAPAGSESTGITFTPNFEYMFLSMQHPNATNVLTTQRDAFGTAVAFDKDVAIVMARAELFADVTAVEVAAVSAETNPSPLPQYALLATITFVLLWHDFHKMRQRS